MPTYRNDGSGSYRINNPSGEAVIVTPGHSVETYDPVVPSDFTLTSNDPTLNKTISGENVFTDWMWPKGQFNISVAGGSWSGEVALQRSFDAGVNVKTYTKYTSDTEAYLTDNDPNASYRIGIPADSYTSGVIVVQLSK